MKKTIVQTWRAASITAILITFTLLLTTNNSYAQYDNWEWAYGFGKTNDYNAIEHGMSVATDSKGNIYATGSYSRAFSMMGLPLENQRGDWNIFLVKFKKDGQVCWVKGIDGKNSYNDETNCVCVDEYDNVYIGGGFASDTLDLGNGVQLVNTGHYDPFIAKFDSAGTALWAVSGRGVEYGFIKGMAVRNGNAYITGEFEGTIIQFGDATLTNHSSSNGFTELFIAKFSTDGVFQWAKSVSGELYEYVFDLDVDKEGNAAIAGKYGGESNVLDFGNGVMLVHDDEFQSLFIAKYDSDGNALWARTAVGSSGLAHESTEELRFDNCGNIFASGDFTSTILKFDNVILTKSNSETHKFWVKLDKEGSVIWAKKSPRATEGHAGGIAIGKSNKLIVYGGMRTDSTVVEMGDSSYLLPNSFLYPYIATLNTLTGDFEWSQIPSYLDPDDFWYIFVSDAVLDNDGNIATIGSYFGYNVGMEKDYFILGNDTLYIHGNNDFFIGRIPITQTVWSNKNDILSFSLAGLEDSVIVDTVNHTVKVTVPIGTSVTNRTPTIILSDNAIICENHKDFSKPVTYTVYAEDGTIQLWTVTVTGWDTSIDEKDAANNIAIYPNPSNGIFTIVVSGKEKGISALNGSVVERSRNAETTIKIYDITGKVIFEQNINTTDKQEINIENHNKGMYYLQLIPKNGEIITRKMIIN